jgi:chemotaxis protein methyltransferase CheR
MEKAMKDSDCVQFLQWALPQLHLRWRGFRKVRGQVCKRIERRIRELRLPDIQTYRDYLQATREEWQVLDGLSRVNISRFYRDKYVFAMLEQEVFPQLAEQALARGEKTLRIWSAGCASGEEPYTLTLLWAFSLRTRFPELKLHVLATDADPHLLRRAKDACYAYSSVKNLPDQWRNSAFTQTDAHYCLHRKFRKQVELRQHDLRTGIPDGPFHLVLCRNLVFTYFETALQEAFLADLREAMTPQGVLLLGVHESLPEGMRGFSARSSRWGIYEKMQS